MIATIVSAAAPSPFWRLLIRTGDLVWAGGAPLVAAAALGQPASAPALTALLGAALAGWWVHMAGSTMPGISSPWPSIARAAGACALAAALAAFASAPGPSGLPPAGLAAALAAAPAIAGRLVFWLLRRDRGAHRALLLGPADCRARLREHLHEHPETGLTVAACCGPDAATIGEERFYPLERIDDAIADVDPDEVIISTGFDDRLLLMETMARLLPRPLTVRYVPDIDAVPLFCPRPSDLAGLPAIDLSRGPLSPTAETVKWLEDKAVATVALLLLGLPMLAIAAAIRLTSPGPAIFVQERHGRHGRPIRVFKFRTMRSEACSQDITTGKFRQASAGDARITRLGRFLRNTSLDELPQFINVLLGDMSVVGPRPHPIALNRRFSSDIGELMRRHYVKPGITGLAQISGSRGETRTLEDMRRRIAFDLEYLRSWSLWLDIRIIARTLFAGWVNRQP